MPQATPPAAQPPTAPAHASGPGPGPGESVAGEAPPLSTPEAEVETVLPTAEASSVAAATGSDVGAGSAAGASSGSENREPSSMGRTGTGAGGRQTFAADELAIVLSHFDIGIITGIQEFPRGSRKAPKLLVRTENAPYLLKRRARGKDDAYKVAFCHGIQLHLAERQFPLPHLIGTRRSNNSMLQYQGTIYELFEYIKGTGYDSSLEATHDSGKVLSLFHKLLRDYQNEYEPSRGSYHGSRHVAGAMNNIPETLAHIDPDQTQKKQDTIQKLVRFLAASYQDAAKRADATGLPEWPEQIVHSDWHPGNMLFRGNRVVAVIDYDAARLQQRVLDVANGALQFSILGGGEDPGTWPDYVDESRYKRFLRGYDSVPDAVLSHAELQAVPWLMIEALIAESVIPIAATGFFARMNGLNFLLMVHRKVRWLQKHADELIAAAG